MKALPQETCKPACVDGAGCLRLAQALPASGVSVPADHVRSLIGYSRRLTGFTGVLKSRYVFGAAVQALPLGAMRDSFYHRRLTLEGVLTDFDDFSEESFAFAHSCAINTLS